MTSMSYCSNDNQKRRQYNTIASASASTPTPTLTLTPTWQLGDVAFLKDASEFDEAEYAELIGRGRLQSGATGHPVIILDRSDDSRYVIITTVSAYSSSRFNDYLPPWEQAVHARKDPNGFRAFEGSARPNTNFQHLKLGDNKLWPKVKTSWVYIHYCYVVPATTLKCFDKSQDQLRVNPESLRDLVGHMKAKSRRFQDQQMQLKAKSCFSRPVWTGCKQTWRREDRREESQILRPRSKSPDMFGAHPGALQNNSACFTARSGPGTTSGAEVLNNNTTTSTSTRSNRTSWSNVAAKPIAVAMSTACRVQVQPRKQILRKQVTVPA
ncbi:hypothetical protein F5Y19DRAFT_469488 [Xylariaceae sp. FL1651]|nr:hypothetical protein F5Y19DRAFT_469488 [Xylariaceae sp. FL1651]